MQHDIVHDPAGKDVSVYTHAFGNPIDSPSYCLEVRPS